MTKINANLEWYRVFAAVAQSGSLTRAAEQLHITQPAVTHTIKQLEQLLGGPLLFRTSRGVKLTEEGALLYRHVEQALHQVITAERKIAEMHQLLQGEVKIGAGDTLCRHYLLPYLKSFHESFPEINIQVTNRTTTETIRLLKDGRIDFGIVNLPLEEGQLSIRTSLSLQDCFVASSSVYGGLAKRLLTPEELAGQPLILLEQGSSIRRHIDRYFETAGVVMQPEIELGSVDLLTDFARAGLGIACIVRTFAEAELASEELVEIRMDPPIPHRHIGLITLKDVPLSAAAARFMDMLP